MEQYIKIVPYDTKEKSLNIEHWAKKSAQLKWKFLFTFNDFRVDKLLLFMWVLLQLSMITVLCIRSETPFIRSMKSRKNCNIKCEKVNNTHRANHWNEMIALLLDFNFLLHTMTSRIVFECCQLPILCVLIDQLRAI